MTAIGHKATVSLLTEVLTTPTIRDASSAFAKVAEDLRGVRQLPLEPLNEANVRWFGHGGSWASGGYTITDDVDLLRGVRGDSLPAAAKGAASRASALLKPFAFPGKQVVQPGEFHTALDAALRQVASGQKAVDKAPGQLAERLASAIERGDVASSDVAALGGGA